MLHGIDEEVCDRCGHVYKACLVLDTNDGLLCLNCRRATGIEDDDVEMTDQGAVDNQPDGG